VTTRDGQEVALSQLSWSLDSYTVDDPQGIPTSRGVEVSLDYVKEAEFGQPEEEWGSHAFTASWPVTITLLDGSVLKDNMGYKAANASLSIHGAWALGDFEALISQVRKITVKRASAPKDVPSTPGTHNILTVGTRAGISVQVAGWTLHTRCVHYPWCCYGDRVDGVPVAGGLDVDFQTVQAAEFGQVPTDGISIPLRITTRAGRAIDTTIRPSTECPTTGWVIEGRAALGTFQLPLSAVQRLEAFTAGTEPTPTVVPPSAFVGTLVALDGTLWPFTSLHRDSYDTSLPLTSGLSVEFGKLKEIRFGELGNGLVPVTMESRDGQTVEGSVSEGIEVTADTELGQLTLAVEEIERITFNP
jgi:hypothetical protein